MTLTRATLPGLAAICSLSILTGSVLAAASQNEIAKDKDRGYPHTRNADTKQRHTHCKVERIREGNTYREEVRCKGGWSY